MALSQWQKVVLVLVLSATMTGRTVLVRLSKRSDEDVASGGDDSGSSSPYSYSIIGSVLASEALKFFISLFGLFAPRIWHRIYATTSAAAADAAARGAAAKGGAEVQAEKAIAR